MLTDSEKKWLERRQPGLYCRWCAGSRDDVYCDYALATDVCPLYEHMESLREAAEFEAKVAAQLLEFHALIMQQGGICEACEAWDECEDAETQCKSLLLKCAYLQVEEEMDAKMDK